MKTLAQQYEEVMKLSKEELQQELKKLDARLPKSKIKQTDAEIAWQEILVEARHNK